MPLVLLLLLGGAVAAGIALSRKGGSAEVDAAMGDKLAKYCTKGPGGEWVFKPDVALGITRTLAGQLYSYVSQSDPTRVIIRPDPTGAPPAADLSALGWARTQNAQMTIMAPVYMAESSSADRYLQAAAPGSEAQQPQLYCVLAYPGTFARNLAPPGVSSTPNALATVVPTALSAAAEELPADLIALYNTLLQNGNDPTQLLLVANELDAVGMNTAAELLRKRAASLGAVSPGGTPVPATHPLDPLYGPSLANPAPVPAPTFVQQAVQQATAIVASMTPLQKAAAAMNVLLNQHGYKMADMPIYKAFQQNAGLGADGYPGSGTMGKLIATLNAMSVPVAPVKVYPWKSTGGYDGVNAPTQAEWSGADSSPPGRLAPGGSTYQPPAGGAAAIQNALNALQGSTNMQAPPAPLAPPGSTPVQAAAVAMNNQLMLFGYRLKDQGIYKAFQAAAGSTADGYPGAGTMGKLAGVLATMGMTMAPVTIFPWKSTGGYDGVNAPTSAQWNS